MLKERIMQKDFHYYCIGVLARAGGFSKQDALTIAYASQYNVSEFIEAAETIYNRLTLLEKNSPEEQIPWKNLRPRIRRLLDDPKGKLDERCERWPEEFADIFEPSDFVYDRLTWRDEALKPAETKKKDIQWDKRDRSHFRSLKFKWWEGFPDSPWVQFHRAALLQRHFVLERLV
jgi:hypothetical protein